MNEFEKLVMFWQLHLAFGDQFYEIASNVSYFTFC